MDGAPDGHGPNGAVDAQAAPAADLHLHVSQREVAVRRPPTGVSVSAGAGSEAGPLSGRPAP